jgi:hypothetical protein
LTFEGNNRVKTADMSSWMIRTGNARGIHPCGMTVEGMVSVSWLWEETERLRYIAVRIELADIRIHCNFPPDTAIYRDCWVTS